MPTFCRLCWTHFRTLARLDLNPGFSLCPLQLFHLRLPNRVLRLDYWRPYAGLRRGSLSVLQDGVFKVIYRREYHLSAVDLSIFDVFTRIRVRLLQV